MLNHGPRGISHVGRSIFFGVMIPWFLSGFIRVRPILMVGFPLALIIPRFLFRRTKTFIEWTIEDSIWMLLAALVVFAYSQSLTPLMLLRSLFG